MSATEEDALEAFFAHNLKLLKTGDQSDISIVCGDRTWKAHKLILCRIEYFNTVITKGRKGTRENQINITNFQPFEIALLLRYIYCPRIDIEVARHQGPTQTFLELCVRLWQLGRFYGIKTLEISAEEQMWKRIECYRAEASHVAEMLKGVPFVSEMEGAIRAAWDGEKASGPPRTLLLSLCQALTPYLHGYPGILALFDEIPGFASDFSKAVLVYGSVLGVSQPCAECEETFPAKKAYLKESERVFRPILGTLTALNGASEKWYCTRECLDIAREYTCVKHDPCEVCEREDRDDSEDSEDSEELTE